MNDDLARKFMRLIKLITFIAFGKFKKLEGYDDEPRINLNSLCVTDFASSNSGIPAFFIHNQTS